MADIVDIAQENIDQSLAVNIAASRSKLQGDGSDDCIECELPIPANRKKAAPGCERCVKCQSEHETKRGSK